MPKASTLHPLLLFIPWIIHFSISSPVSAEALQLELIHRDSTNSPLYPGKLTTEEMLHNFYRYTESYANQSSEAINSRIRTTDGFIYLVQLTVAARNPSNHQSSDSIFKYHFIMDTGSDLTWMQCEPCKTCWKQTSPIFDPERSQNCTPIPCHHHLCDLQRPGWSCLSDQCHYSERYTNGNMTRGIIAKENFSFSTKVGSEWRELVFGCGHENTNSKMPPYIAGVLGLGFGNLSVVNQLSQPMFSYCLQPFKNTEQLPTVLRFGYKGILVGPNVKTVPFTPISGPVKRFYLNLVDVSIASKRIGFNPGTFDVQYSTKGFATGGFIIDSGAQVSSFMHDPYTMIKSGFTQYFESFGLKPLYSEKFMCYEKGARKITYPSMTLHFHNGRSLVIKPEQLVIETNDQMCIAIARTANISILGAYQQQNYKFSYDLQLKILSYAPADCSLEESS